MALSTTNEAIHAAQRILEAVSQEAAIARLIGEGDPSVARLNRFYRQNIIRTQLITHAWRKIGRQVLAMHPAVVDEVKVASSDKIPAQVLRTLPYMNPLVVFADPPVFKTWLKPGEVHPGTGLSEDSMRLLGFLTYGNADVWDGSRLEQRIYSTNSTEADRFGMMLMLETLDAQGKAIDMEFNSMTIYFDQDLTLAETVDDLISRFYWDSPRTQLEPENFQRKWMRDVLSVVVGSLFYLCSTTLEAEKVPTRATRNLGKGITRKPLSLYRVGWTTGAALTRYRQSRRAGWTEGSVQGDITHEQDPQHRRAHFKMQPYGPRNSLRKLILVGAYWTKVERLGEQGMNTARAVPSLGKGEPKESVRTALEMRGVVSDS